MKNVTSKLLGLVLVCSSCFFACSDDSDDNGSQSSLQEKFITVDQGTYVEGELPVGSNDGLLEKIELGESVLPGGSSFLKLVSQEELKTVHLSVQGEKGYIKVDLKEDDPGSKSTVTLHTYTIIVSISQQLTADFTIELTVVNVSGEVSGKYVQQLKYIEAGTGTLQVSLHFDNAKDLDLYVVEPNGNVICYDNPFPYCTEAYKIFNDYLESDEDFDEESIPGWGKLGLDVDSNAGCEIDNFNNENIFFNADNMQKGKYQVYVNMFGNCDPSVATGYVVKATYKGKTHSVAQGSNPYVGKFPVGTPDNEIGMELTGAVKVMEFVIDEGKTAPAVKSFNRLTKNRPGKLMR